MSLEENSQAKQNKRKKKPVSKTDRLLKAVSQVPMEDRWWNIWHGQENEDLAKYISRPPTYSQGLMAGESEVIWNRYAFDRKFHQWIGQDNIFPEMLFSKP